jgi:hypothetical protein
VPLLGVGPWPVPLGRTGGLAGLDGRPLSAITNTGGCAYVYPRPDWYFARVSDPTGLRCELLKSHAGLAAGVERFAPATPAEAEDLAFMRGVAGRMRELVEQACEVERARWSAERSRSV